MHVQTHQNDIRGFLFPKGEGQCAHPKYTLKPKTRERTLHVQIARTSQTDMDMRWDRHVARVGDPFCKAVCGVFGPEFVVCVASA